MTHPEGMQIKVSRQELSRLVGCSREMAGRVLKVLEEQGLLRATGKTIVVFNARPKVKTRPLIVPVKAAAGSAAPAAKNTQPASHDEDDDEDDDDSDGDQDARALQHLEVDGRQPFHFVTSNCWSRPDWTVPRTVRVADQVTVLAVWEIDEYAT